MDGYKTVYSTFQTAEAGTTVFLKSDAPGLKVEDDQLVNSIPMCDHPCHHLFISVVCTVVGQAYDKCQVE